MPVNREEDLLLKKWCIFTICPSTRTPAPGGHEIYNFCRPFLDHYD